MFLKAESYRKGIVYSVLFSGLAKTTGFLNIFIIAWFFGTGGTTDLYFFLLNVAQLLASFISLLNSSVIIPESMRIREQESEEKAIRFLNSFLFIYLIIGILTVGLISIAPINFFSYFSGFNQLLLSQNTVLLFGTPILFILMIVSHLLITILSSYMFFTVPMIVISVNNIISLVFVLFFHDKMGVVSILYGLLLGYALNILFLLVQLKISLKWKFNVVSFKIPRLIKKNILFAQLANLSLFGYNYLSLFMLSGLNVGLISALNYGQKVADVPHHLITSQFSSVAGIKFNEEYARRNFKQLNRVFIRSLNFVVFLMVPISVFTFIYSKPIVSVVFERGAFTDYSTGMTVMFLKYLILLLPLLAFNTFVGRVFMASQKIKSSSIYQIFFSIIQLGIIYLLIKHFGGEGYAWAMVIGNVLNVFFLYFFMKTYFPEIHYNTCLLYFFKVLIINMAIGSVTYLLTSMFVESSLISIISALIIYVSLLMIINYFLKLNVEFNVVIFKNRKTIGNQKFSK